jgi:hypothetical protein
LLWAFTLLLVMPVADAPAAEVQSCKPLDIPCGMGKRAPRSNERLPGILLSDDNTVPACVTPERLMRFLANRRKDRFDRAMPVDTRFKGVAAAYQRLGEKVGVRWDLAFFQMMYETGHLSFTSWSNKRRRWSDAIVRPEQMNFAGLGATIENPKGETFKSLDDGVLFHLKHLLAYSGNIPVSPTAYRTCAVKAEVVACALSLGRPVTFTDMTDMWAHKARENRYAQTLRSLARDFAEESGCGPAYPFAGATGEAAVSEAEAAAFITEVEEAPAEPVAASRPRRSRASDVPASRTGDRR